MNISAPWRLLVSCLCLWGPLLLPHASAQSTQFSLVHYNDQHAHVEALTK